MENGMEGRTGLEAQAENQQENDLNELLRNNAGLQSQFDRLVSKALNTARSRWERECAPEGGQDGTDRERALDERERALTLRERRADMLKTLGERGLPRELAEILPMGENGDAPQALDALEQAFTAEVRRAVEERMKGMPPKGGGEAAYASQMRAALGLK